VSRPNPHDISKSNVLVVFGAVRCHACRDLASRMAFRRKPRTSLTCKRISLTNAVAPFLSGDVVWICECSNEDQVDLILKRTERGACSNHNLRSDDIALLSR